MSSLLAFTLPGGPEWILIFLVVLLLFGAKKLPDLARGLARSLTEFRKAKDEFDQELAASKSSVSLHPPKNGEEIPKPTAHEAPSEVPSDTRNEVPAGSSRQDSHPNG